MKAPLQLRIVCNQVLLLKLNHILNLHLPHTRYLVSIIPVLTLLHLAGDFLLPKLSLFRSFCYTSVRSACLFSPKCCATTSDPFSSLSLLGVRTLLTYRHKDKYLERSFRSGWFINLTHDLTSPGQLSGFPLSGMIFLLLCRS